MTNQDPFFVPENIKSGQGNSHKWTEGIFPSGSAFGNKGGEYLSLSLTKKKLTVLLLLAGLGLGVLFIRSFYLQIIRGDYFFSLAENNRIRTKYTKSQRGIIYDRNGQPLVQNIFGFSLLITPADLPAKEAEKEQIIETVATILNIQSSEIHKLIDPASHYYFQPVAIKSGINYEQAMTLKIASADLPGVTLEVDYWRNYLSEPELSHLLGYVGKISAEEYEKNSDRYLLSDNIGKAGLENYYEECLKGQHGQKKIEVDVLGREKKIVSHLPFVPGCSLVLTIDADLQKKVYQILAERLGDDKAGAVVVSNPQNGQILALVDYPAYNNNLFATGISHDDYQALLDDKRNPLFARSLLGEYPSGSTIKLLIASAALEEKIITPNKNFNSVGGIWVADQWFFPDWKAGGHGLTNVYKALAESVNTFFYYIGGGYQDFTGLGVDLISHYLSYFGLGKKTGIDLPGERMGLIPTQEWKRENKNEEWYIGDTYHLAIGQGDILVTPIQVNGYNMAIANGGTLYQPYLVKEIIHPDQTRELIMPAVLNENFIKPENIAVVRQGMRQAVTSGSSVYLYDAVVPVAGKTGTAQWHPQKEDHAWFAGFAPYENPTLAITVLVEEGGEGSSVAVPIAKEIINYWFTK